MCKRNKQWITVLGDLGYDAQIIEQKINTSSGEVVKPDIITASNKLLHSIVFECKGGLTVDPDQLKRYSSLTRDDLLRWITVFDRNNLRFDICVSDFLENHGITASINQVFPMFTFSSEVLQRTREFKVTPLNEAFKDPISLKEKVPPLSYYPFSEEDKDPYIAIHVVRSLLSIAIKNMKGGPDVFEESIISFDEIAAHKFHSVWKALAQEHKQRLQHKIRDVIQRLMARPNLKEALTIIQQKRGIKIARNLDQFTREAEDFIDELQKQEPLSKYL